MTYDLGVSSTGVLHIAPFGTKPDAVVDSPRIHDLPAWLPRLPIGTPQNRPHPPAAPRRHPRLVLFVRRSLYPRPTSATPRDAPT